MAQLTDEEWQRLLPLLHNIKPERQQAAYNRLVKGMTYVKAGELYGYSRQDVNTIVQSVLKKHAQVMSMPQTGPVPRGWIRVEFVVPRRKVDEVRRVVAAMCAQPEQVAAPAENGPVRSRARPSK